MVLSGLVVNSLVKEVTDKEENDRLWKAYTSAIRVMLYYTQGSDDLKAKQWLTDYVTNYYKHDKD